MKEEIEELEKQNTWDIVSTIPNNRILLRTQWVYKIKTNNENNPIQYKSRLAVQGYN